MFVLRVYVSHPACSICQLEGECVNQLSYDVNVKIFLHS